MWRLLHFAAIAALVGSAVYAYSIKYETIWYAEQIVKTNHKITAEHDQIAMLRATWAHLTRPERTWHEFVRDLFRTRLDKSVGRIRVVALGFTALYCVVGVRLVMLGMRHDAPETFKHVAAEAAAAARPDILDRNGEILATDVK